MKRFVLAILPSGGAMAIAGPFACEADASVWCEKFYTAAESDDDDRVALIMQANPFHSDARISILKLDKRSDPTRVFCRKVGAAA